MPSGLVSRAMGTVEPRPTELRRRAVDPLGGHVGRCRCRPLLRQRLVGRRAAGGVGVAPHLDGRRGPVVLDHPCQPVERLPRRIPQVRRPDVEQGVRRDDEHHHLLTVLIPTLDGVAGDAAEVDVERRHAEQRPGDEGRALGRLGRVADGAGDAEHQPGPEGLDAARRIGFAVLVVVVETRRRPRRERGGLLDRRRGVVGHDGRLRRRRRPGRVVVVATAAARRGHRHRHQHRHQPSPSPVSHESMPFHVASNGTHSLDNRGAGFNGCGR